MSVQKAEVVTCDNVECYGHLVYMGGPVGIAAVAESCGWRTVKRRDVCPACVAGTGPITKTACPNCGGCGGNLICVYCGCEQPRDVED